MKRFVIDTDCGVDDAVAVTIALIPYLATVIALTIYSAQALRRRTRRVEEARQVGKIKEIEESS